MSRRLTANILLSLCGTVAARFSTFLTLALVARHLGTSEYGQYAFLQNTVGMFATFAGFGLGLAATRFIAAEYNNDVSHAYGVYATCMKIAVVSGGAATLAAAIFAHHLLPQAVLTPRLVVLLVISSPVLILSAITGVQQGTLAGLEDFKELARLSIISSLATSLLTAGGVYLAGLPGAVVGSLIGQLVTVLVYSLRTRIKLGDGQLLRRSVDADSVLTKRIIAFVVPTVLANSLTGPTLWLCATLVANHAKSFAPIGIIASVEPFQYVLTIISMSVGTAILPALARSKNQDSRLEKINMIISWAIGIFPGVLVLGIPEIQATIFGTEFGGDVSRKVCSIYMIGACVTLFNHGISRSIVARGDVWLALANNATWSLLCIALILLWARWGAIGYAAAYTVAYTAKTILFIPLLLRRGYQVGGLMTSPGALLAWACLILTAIASYINVPLQWRLLLTSGVLLIISLCFIRMVELDVKTVSAGLRSMLIKANKACGM